MNWLQFSWSPLKIYKVMKIEHIYEKELIDYLEKKS
jgi:hypothetical protein